MPHHLKEKKTKKKSNALRFLKLPRQHIGSPFLHSLALRSGSQVNAVSTISLTTEPQGGSVTTG